MKDHADMPRPTPPMLINQISRMFDERMRERLPAGHPMTQNSCRFIMRMLSHGDGITGQDIVKETNMKASTISVAIKNLEEEGLISRETDKNDMRVVRVYMTERGREFDEKFKKELRDLDAALMDGISEKEAEILFDLLLRVRENVRNKGERKRAENI